MKYSSPVSRNSDDLSSVTIDLPEKFFEMQPSEFCNDKIYLTNEFLDNSFNSNFSSNVSSQNFFKMLY